MEHSEKLKNKGNACFTDGDVKGAKEAYLQAIEYLEKMEVGRNDGHSSENSDVGRMLAILYSNLSNVYLSQGKYSESWKAAEEGTRRDPTFLKAWIRYVHARRLDGYPFEAFVALLRYVRPLLRKEPPSSAAKTMRDLESEINFPLYESLGLSNVSPHIALQDFESGVGIVALQPLKPNDVILVEKKFQASPVDVHLGPQDCSTTTEIVLSFAQKALPHQRRRSDEWKRLKKEFEGCWPRSPTDVPSDIQNLVMGEVRPLLPRMSDSDFEELFLVSMMCRYNCFYHGFFRACALANHSCVANAAMKFDAASNTVTLIAVRPVEAGEFVNVKYLSDAQLLMGVGNRREYLRSWLFWCGCERCTSDNDPNAFHEHVQCTSCQQYTHLPFCGNYGEDNKEEDPLLPHEAPCAHCGAVCTWSPESRETVNQLIGAFKDVVQCGLYSNLIEWFMENLSKIDGLSIHPEHWLYRVLLYFFCVVLTSFTTEAFKHYQRVGWQAPNLELLLCNFGYRPEHHLPTESCVEGANMDVNNPKSSGTTANSGKHHSTSNTTEAQRKGGDALYILCSLWRLIEPFYPAYEGWALHRAICHLVLFAHTHPKEHLALPGPQAIQLLCRHGKFIGKSEASLWIQAYGQYKSANSRGNMLSVKQVKNAFDM